MAPVVENKRVGHKMEGEKQGNHSFYSSLGMNYVAHE